MKISAGILLEWNGRYLLCHPSKSSWFGTYSPPKGEVDPGEFIRDAALREFKEETSIDLNPSLLDNIYPIDVIYSNKQNNITKIVHLYKIRINSLSELGLESDVLDKSRLQINEIDWCGFLNKSECMDRIFWRFKHLI